MIKNKGMPRLQEICYSISHIGLTYQLHALHFNVGAVFETLGLRRPCSPNRPSVFCVTPLGTGWGTSGVLLDADVVAVSGALSLSCCTTPLLSGLSIFGGAGSGSETTSGIGFDFGVCTPGLTSTGAMERGGTTAENGAWLDVMLSVDNGAVDTLLSLPSLFD